MKKILMAIAATLMVASPAFAKSTRHPQPRGTGGLYMQAAPRLHAAPRSVVTPEAPAMMIRGMPNTSPDPFINDYLIRSYRGTGQG